MAKSTHTPEIAASASMIVRMTDIASSNGLTMVKCPIEHPTAARAMIAAGPDLLAAAEMVLDWWHEWHDKEPAEEAAAFEALSDALAKSGAA